MITNLAELAQNHGGEKARILLSALDYAIRQVDPAVLVKRAVKVDTDTITVRGISGEKIALSKTGYIFVVGAGKASARMASSLCSILGGRVIQGAITIPHNDRPLKTKNFPSVLEVTEGAHPIPDLSGLEGSKKIVKLIEMASPNDLVFVLISGGGSALLPMPAPGLALSDKQNITHKLLRSGATIQEVNVIRKHLSAIKGGQLARHSNGARIVSLILSDVIGDDVSAIASGPTCPDPSTFTDALRILKKYGLVDLKDPAARHIVRGSRRLVKDTPKPGDRLFDRIDNVLIGNNAAACSAASRFLTRHGIRTALLGSNFDGEARKFGAFLARFASDLSESKMRQYAVVVGGETTVTMKGRAGIGGRNQEAALSCAIRLSGGMLVACMGTDGIDGSSDAAGSLVSEHTRSQAKRKRVDLARHLKEHDSYTALQATDSLIFTGKTGTNVNDIAIICTAD